MIGELKMEKDQLLMMLMFSGLGGSGLFGSSSGSGDGDVFGGMGSIFMMSMMLGGNGGSLFSRSSSGSAGSGFFSGGSGNSGSGEDGGFGDDAVKILSIPLAKQVLDAITIKLNSLSEERKNQLISALLLMTIAEKEGGEIGEILSVASMMGLQPLMSNNGSTKALVGSSRRTNESVPTKQFMRKEKYLSLGSTRVGGQVRILPAIENEVSALTIDGSLGTSSAVALHESFIESKRKRRQETGSGRSFFSLS